MSSCISVEGLLKAAQRDQNWEQVVVLSRKLRNRNPKAQAYYIFEARGLFMLGKVGAAIEIIDQVCQKFPENSSAWINRAEFLSAGALCETELQLHQDLVKRFPDHAIVHVHAMKVFTRLDAHEMARDSAYSAYKIEPSAQINAFLIEALNAGGFFEEALAAAKRSRKDFPDSATGYISPMVPLIHLRRYDEAYRLSNEWFKRDTPKRISDYKACAQMFLQTYDVPLENPESRVHLVESLLLEPKAYNSVSGCSSLVLEVQSTISPDLDVFSKIVAFLDANVFPHITSSEWEIVKSRVSLGLEVRQPFDEVIIRILNESGYTGLCRNFSKQPAFKGNVEKLKAYLKNLTLDTLPPSKVFEVLEIAYGLYIPMDERDPAITKKFIRNTFVSEQTKQVKLDQPLRIAVCVSGQMRGYKTAFSSWSRLGLDQHETDYYVHTWEEIGRKYPIPAHAWRCFDGHFLEAYQDTLTRHSLDKLERLFPSMYNCFRQEGIVTEAELNAVYGVKEAVIEDDQSDEFNKFSNSMKMYYKIQKCAELVDQSGREYDLVIRLRPDKMLDAIDQKVDWHAVYEKCASGSAFYVEGIFHLILMTGVYLGDQFAVGTQDAMREYSKTYENTLDPNHPIQRFKPGFDFHSNLAFSVYYAGLETISFNSMLPNVAGSLGGLMDPKLLSASVLLECIQSDISNRPPAIMDQAWISALQQDIADKGN